MSQLNKQNADLSDTISAEIKEFVKEVALFAFNGGKKLGGCISNFIDDLLG